MRQTLSGAIFVIASIGILMALVVVAGTLVVAGLIRYCVTWARPARSG